MKRIFKFFGITILLIILVVIVFFTYYYVMTSRDSLKDMNLLGKEAPILQIDGISFRDLNKNGKLDVYEDTRAEINTRVDDLIKQMNLEEKAGSLFINMTAMNSTGKLSNVMSPTNPFSLLLESNVAMVARKKMTHVNIMQSPSPEAMITWNNNIQKIAERTRLGIPMTIASDPRHGVPNAPGASIYTPFFSKWPSTLGLAAARDTVLTREFGNIARQEYLAMGIRLTLSPMADLATEPRWARINGTFGEDAELAASMTKAYILGFQGDTINHQSVECMVKHFAGGGPQKGGLDAHFPPGKQAYPGNNFAYHLIPFEKGAFAAHVAQVMPYYGIPVGQTKEDVGFGYNKEIITGLLRNKYHFDGIICTDWALISDAKLFGLMVKPAAAHGVEKLSQEERILKILDAGCDMFGGESLTDVIVKLVKTGKLSEERINQSLKRILKEKFRLGLFDNPYLKAENASIVNSAKFIEKGLEAQRRSLILLKNDQSILPLKPTTKIYLQGFNKEESAPYAHLVTDAKNADVIILKLNTPYGLKAGEEKYLMQKIFHQGHLDFDASTKTDLLKLMQTKPTITVMNLERPAVFPEINAASKAMIGDFSSQDNIILDLIFGKFKPTGKLPFELPSSMSAVEKQKEDVPYDSENPLYRFGFGLSYQ
ncbi:MAG: glycoside hydrolase family 3 N-terminal domain-containing protein [Bacteroidota bacterium]